nr:glycosyltransferase [Geoanaerobacter pelophilus]
MTKSPLFISVVIATFNRAEHLEKCLVTLDLQSCDRDSFEVIVVNDGSTDNTDEVLKSFANRCSINFRTAHHENRGVSYSRNVGISLSRGEFILFTDDDCRLPASWISQCIGHIEHLSSDVIGIGGPLDSIVEEGSRFAAEFVKYIDEFNHIPTLGRFRIRPVHVKNLTVKDVVPYLRTSNALFRKRMLIEVKGFDEVFRRPGGEDPDICFRLLALGGRFEFDTSLVVRHVCRATLAAYFKTLANYVGGEYLCRKNRRLYPFKALRLNYEYIPLQKICSSILALIGYPGAVVKASALHGHGLGHAMIFPLLVAISKKYALWIAMKCQLDEWRKAVACYQQKTN